MSKHPNHLCINGRKKLSSSSFATDHRLYRSFDESDLDDLRKLKYESIPFPDLSCNWSLFSKPEDVRFRENGKPTDGCYSFTVKVARYKNTATPVHNPRYDKTYPNYAHVEVRELFQDENILFEPPTGRKRKEWRLNLSFNHLIELDAG